MVACAVAIPDINQALKGTNGRLFPLGLIRLLLRKRYIIAGAAAAARRRRALSRASASFPLLLSELAPADAGHAVPRAPSSRGCSRTTATSTSPPRSPARAATRPTASTRRRCDACGSRSPAQPGSSAATSSSTLARAAAPTSSRVRRPFERARARATRYAAPTRSSTSPAWCQRVRERGLLRRQRRRHARGRRSGARGRRAADPHLEPRGRRPGVAATRRDRKTTRRRRSTPTAAASSKASGWSPRCDGLRWTILRPGVVYGPRRSRAAAAVPRSRRAASCRSSAAPTRRTRSSTSPISSARSPPRVDSAGERRHRCSSAIRDPVTTRDAPRRRARGGRPPRRRDRPRAAGDHAAGGPRPATSAARVCGKPLPINSRRYAELAAEGFVCRVDRLRDRLGVVAEIELREGLAQTAAWYRREAGCSVGIDDRRRA